eukprot:2932348-Pleurochrysis_carterae.AAC.1
MEIARMHTVLMCTDVSFLQRLARIASSRSCARDTKIVMRTVGLTMAIAEKRQAGTCVLWLRVVFIAAAEVLFLPRDRTSRAVDCI